MERKVGETFNFEGIKLRVKSTGCEAVCDDCYFDEYERKCSGAHTQNYIGHCYEPFRSDGKNVIFVEVEND